ncbi:protein DBF4-like protein [Vairimorpha necatrix]|uniref:Protein DBF4-like protein n=1 Tax=Vairimorpha necatrix TaxID=6039 RepID=A0AAX4J9Z5_9MICR
MKNYKIFKKKYILIEDLQGSHQPFYKEYTTPPKLSLSSKPLGCPYQENKKFKPSTKKKGPKAGFCEVCYTKFSDYDLHVREYEHREFAKDFNNYKKIDQFISSTKFINEEEELTSSPLGRLTSSTQVCDYDYAYDRILHFSRVSTDNSDNKDEVVNFKEWLRSLD